MSFYTSALALVVCLFLNTGSAANISTHEPEVGNCPKIDHVGHSTILVTGGNKDSIEINNTSRIENTVVKVTCHSDSFQINGIDVITCKNGTWTPEIPTCIPKTRNAPPKDYRLWYYIGGGAGGGVIIITMVTIIIGCICRKKSRKRDSEKTELAMSDLDTRRWSNGMPDGISVIGSASQYGMTSPKSFYKVWSLNRSRKKFVKAENFKQLIKKVGPLFGINGPLKLVLEEDGTEIENDEALDACADKPFIVLQNGQTWSNTAAVKESKPRLTFDICSYDRATRKLILANSLRDLLHQASICLDYTAECACLEEDGTEIDDDKSLLAFAGSTLMMLGKGHVWTISNMHIGEEFQNRLGQLDVVNSSFDHTEDGRKFFKVWSKDGKERKIVLAKDLVDLHIKASTLFGISPPVYISVYNEDVVISDDNDLLEHSDKTLIVSAAQSENTSWSENPLHTDSPIVHRNQSKGNGINRNRDSWESVVNRRLELIPGTDGSEITDFGRNSGYYLPNESKKNNRIVDPVFDNRGHGGRMNEGFDHDGQSRRPNHYPDNQLENLRSGYQDRSHIGPNKYNQQYSDNNISEKYQRHPKRHQKHLDEHDGHNTPLPYEDLSPVYKRYRHPNIDLGADNFAFTSDTKQPQMNKSKKSKMEKKRDKPEIDMSDYHGSFLATGGQKQNRHSDVYY